MSNNEDATFSEQVIDDAFNETEKNGAITRSVHIVSNLIEVTITSQDPKEDLNMIKGMVEDLIDKYKDTAPKYG